MITLRKVSLHNFLSHRESVVDIGPTSQIVLDGNSGSGKSSVFEAIVWGLYGEGRSANTELIYKGAEKGGVVIEFSDNDKHYTLKRSVSNKGKQSLVVVCNGEEIQKGTMRDLQAYLEREVYRASYLLFTNSVAYLQGNANTFVAQTATRRKELLLELADCGDFDELYQKTRGVASTVQSEIIAENARANTWREIIKDRETVVANEGVYAEELAHIFVQITEKQNIVENEKAKYYGLKNQVENAQATKVTITTIQSQIEEAERASADIENINVIVSADELVVAKEPELKERYQSTTQRAEEITLMYNNALAGEREKARILGEKPTVTNLDVVITQLEKQKESLLSGKQCPAGEQCPFMQDIQNQVNQVESRIQAVREQQITETYRMKEWQTKYDAIPTIDMKALEERRNEVTKIMAELNAELRNLDDSARRLLVNKERIERAEKLALQLPALRNTLTALVASQIDTTDYQKQLIEVETILKQLENELAVLNANKTVYQAHLTNVESARKDIVTLREQVKEVEIKVEKNNAVLNDLLALQDAFGSKGIKTVVIDYILPTLEARINSILSQMSDFRVELSTQVEKASGDGSKEGLFINIVNDMGETMSFENYSGGEKLRIIIAISEALAGLQRFGFRLFDEALLSLDENSLEGLLKVLGQLLSKFPQVLCISHIEEVKDVFPQRLMIRKNNGVSVIS